MLDTMGNWGFVQSSRRDDPNRPQASISCAGKGAIIEVYWPGDNEWYRGKVGKIESKVRRAAITSVCDHVDLLSWCSTSAQCKIIELWNIVGIDRCLGVLKLRDS